MVGGTGFGELALMLATSRRQATVVASKGSSFLSAEGSFQSGCDLIVIDRNCYNRSIGANTDNSNSSLSERITHLKSMPQFVGWTDDHLFELAYSMKDRSYRAGQKIYRAEDKVIGTCGLVVWLPCLLWAYILVIGKTASGITPPPPPICPNYMPKVDMQPDGSGNPPPPSPSISLNGIY
jgi:hypothetical protein